MNVIGYRWPSLYATADESDSAVAAFVRQAGREATAWRDGPHRLEPSDKLLRLAAACDLRQLNHLAECVMVRQPTTWGVASGNGGKWAVASELVNVAARAALMTKHKFELLS